jgi:hypothetical protein
MPESKLRVPLAFILALSAAASGADALGRPDPSSLLTPGSLKELLSPSEKAIAGSAASNEGASHNSAAEMAQWGNWLNCFAGNWRRC